MAVVLLLFQSLLFFGCSYTRGYGGPIRRALFQRLFQSLCPLQGNTVFNPERAIFAAAFGEIYFITK